MADRLLESTGNVLPFGRSKQQVQVMDGLEVRRGWPTVLADVGVGRRWPCGCVIVQIERQRGITVKAQTASMLHQPSDQSEPWLINLIDTPGTVLRREGEDVFAGTFRLIAAIACNRQATSTSATKSVERWRHVKARYCW